MAIPIAAILAAAQLISSGAQRVQDKWDAKKASYRARTRLNQDAFLRAAERRGADTSVGRNILAEKGIDQSLYDAERAIENRPVDYGSIAGVIQGATAALGGGSEKKAGTPKRVFIASPQQPTAPGEGGGEGVEQGYISPSRIQAPTSLPEGGADRLPSVIITGPSARPRDEDDEYGYGFGDWA